MLLLLLLRVLGGWTLAGAVVVCTTTIALPGA